MRPPNQRPDLDLMPELEAFLACYDKVTPTVEKILQRMHVEARLKNLAEECQKLRLLLEESKDENKSLAELAPYVLTAEDSLEDAKEMLY